MRKIQVKMLIVCLLAVSLSLFLCLCFFVSVYFLYKGSCVFRSLARFFREKANGDES